MTPASHSKLRTIALCLFVMTTILWGTSFIITKIIIQDLPVFLYISIRSSIAIIGFFPVLTHLKYVNKKVIRAGLLTGFAYYLAITFQTFGLQTTTAGKAGFTTGLSTVIVPFMIWIFYKKKPKKRIWIAVILSIMGLALLLLEGGNGLIIGDILVLICAFFCALYIIYVDKYVKCVDIYQLIVIQLIVISLLSFASSIILRETFDLASMELGFWVILIYMGIGVSTITIFFQSWGQKYIDASQSAIIFTLEPVFAAFFGFLLGNELLTWQALIGCGCILLAILISVIKNEDKAKNTLKSLEILPESSIS